ISPSTSTTATRLPPKEGPVGSRRTRTPRITRKQAPSTSRVTPIAAQVRRRITAPARAPEPRFYSSSSPYRSRSRRRPPRRAPPRCSCSSIRTRSAASSRSDRPIRRSFGSTRITFRVSSSPSWTTSSGRLTGWVDIWEMWSSPSTPGSSSTKAPNSVRRSTLPLTLALVDRLPRIGLDLLHAEGDALLHAVDVEDHHLDLVSHVDDLGRVADAPRPGHLRHVHEALDAPIELDEGAVVGQAHHLARVAAPHGKALLDGLPGIRALLLVSERDATRLAVEVEDDDVDP